MHNAARPLNTAKQIPLDPQARLGAAARQVDSMRDALGKPVDAGIKSLVTALNVSGFPTTASCEGHLDWGVPAPWVDVAPVPTQESVALYRALCALDAEIETIGYADPEAPALEHSLTEDGTWKPQYGVPRLFWRAASRHFSTHSIATGTSLTIRRFRCTCDLPGSG